MPPLRGFAVHLETDFYDDVAQMGLLFKTGLSHCKTKTYTIP